MNIWSVAVKEFKHDMRDKQTMFIMLALPIVMILVLGTALSNAFSNEIELGDMKLLYDNSAASESVSEAWGGFMQAIGRQNIEIAPIAADTDGIKEVQEGRATAYAVIGDSGIQFYGSSKHTIESNVLQGMLNAYADRTNLWAAVAAADPAAVPAIMEQANAAYGFIRETGLDSDRMPGSMDYYAIAMSTMIALYASLYASFLIRGERVRKTAIRLTAAPIRKSELFVGKVLGNTLLNTACVVVVVLFSKFVYQANWGDHLGIVMLALVTEVLMAVSIGLGVGYMLKENAAVAVLMIIAQLASFLGGAYFPISELTGFLSLAANFSPLYWMNTGLTNLIYNGDVQAVLPAIGLNLGIATLFLVFSAMMMRRREAL